MQATNLGAAALTRLVGCELSYLPLAFLPACCPGTWKGANTMKRNMFTRRRFMATSAAASAMIAAPFVRTTHAAGKLSIGFWDHFVTGANKNSDAVIKDWAATQTDGTQMELL